MDIKYIYTEQGQQESVILPIEFWNDIFNKFELGKQLQKESYFTTRYKKILLNLSIQAARSNKKDDFFSLFGSWESEKTGEEINNEIYNSRNDSARDIIL